MPSSTRATGKSTSFIARKTSSSSESRLTVTRVRPARARLSACRASSAPFVVSVRSTSPSARELAHEHRQVAPDEWLAAGDADLLDAACDEDARDPLDLLERQQLLARQELVLAAEDLLRHAVDAPEVAAVGDGDAQVAQRPPERVGHRHAVSVPAARVRAMRAVRGSAKELPYAAGLLVGLPRFLRKPLTVGGGARGGRGERLSAPRRAAARVRPSAPRRHVVGPYARLFAGCLLRGRRRRAARPRPRARSTRFERSPAGGDLPDGGRVQGRAHRSFAAACRSTPSPALVRNPQASRQVRARSSGSRGTRDTRAFRLALHPGLRRRTRCSISRRRGGLGWEKATWEAPGAGCDVPAAEVQRVRRARCGRGSRPVDLGTGPGSIRGIGSPNDLSAA